MTTTPEWELKPKTDLLNSKMIVDRISVGGYDVVVYKLGNDVMHGVFMGDTPLLGVYNDMGRALLFSASRTTSGNHIQKQRCS